MMTKLVVYAICRDEADLAEKWYNSVREADEVVVLDTGSKDGTPDILERLGATVWRDYPGFFRFDKARNLSLGHVPEDADICFSIDLDERFETPGWAAVYKKAWEHREKGVNALSYRFVMNRRHHSDGTFTDEGVWWKENCHTRRGWHWEYPVHNLLVPDEGVEPIYQKVPPEFPLIHHQQPRADRVDRIALHWLNAAERPDAPRPMYYLGREYFYRGDYAEAVKWLDKYLKNAGEFCWHDEKGNALYYEALCYEALGDLKNAELAALRAVAETHGREPLLLLTNLYYKQNKWHAAKFYGELALSVDNNHAYFRDDAAYAAKPHDYLTMVYWKLGDKEKALAEAKKCLEYEPENPRFRSNLAAVEGREEKPAEKPAETPAPAVPGSGDAGEGITVAYSVTDDWRFLAAVSLYSLLRFNKVAEVLFLTESGEPGEEAVELCKKFGVTLRCFHLGRLIGGMFRPDCPNLESEYTDAALGRLALPRLTQKDRVLYLDADTVVHGDLSELWTTDLDGYAMAGVRKTDRPAALEAYCRELCPEGVPCYVNSGVLLMNLRMMREENLDTAAVEFLHGRKLQMPDQDALNVVCAGKTKALPVKFNSSLSCGIVPEPLITHYACRKRWFDDPTAAAWNDAVAGLATLFGKNCGLDTRPTLGAVAYSVTADWQDKLAVSLYTLLKHNKVENLYLIIEGGAVSPEIERLCERFNVGRLRVFDLNDLLADRLHADSPNRGHYFSNAAFGRLFLPEEIEDEKILYLDADTIVHAGLGELWNTDLDGFDAAGVTDARAIERHKEYLDKLFDGANYSGYINSGVLLMNCAEIRRTAMWEVFYHLLNTRETRFADQDIINLALRGKIRHVGNEYNSSISCGIVEPAKIAHFAGFPRFWEDERCQGWLDAAAEYRAEFPQ